MFFHQLPVLKFKAVSAIHLVLLFISRSESLLGSISITLILSSRTWLFIQSVQLSQSCLTLCDRIDCSTTGFPVHHQLPELAQTHIHQVSDTIQPSYHLSSPSPPAFNLSQHQSLFQWVRFSHQMVKVLDFQLQHQSFQWIFRTDFF